MDIIRDQLEEILSKLHNRYDSYSKEFESCPPGRLINNKNHGVATFYHSLPLGNNNYRRRQLTGNNEMITQLARKEFLAKSINSIQSNIKHLQRAMNCYESLNPADIINGMGRAYRMLDDKSFFKSRETDLWDFISNNTDFADEALRVRCERHKEWAEKEYTKNPYPFPDEKFLTSSGMRVRSRGEIIISDRLEHFGIPNRFDQLIYLCDGSSAAPDFSFEDRNMDEFYLQYCGMMDDSVYVSKHLSKRNRYERSGIVPWKNICYLYSTGSGISVPEIDSVIMNFIIPRL